MNVNATMFIPIVYQHIRGADNITIYEGILNFKEEEVIDNNVPFFT